MVWANAEERLRIHREKDVRDLAARQEEKGKAKEEVYGCTEGGHAGGKIRRTWKDEDARSVVATPKGATKKEDCP